MSRRKVALSAAVAVLAVAAGGLALSRNAASSESPTTSDASAEASQTLSTATVERGDLKTSRDFQAKAGFGDTFDVPVTVTGTVTFRRSTGDIVQFGESLIRVNELPVFLVEGTTPLYRTLSKTDTTTKDASGNRVKHLEGDDVRQLQTFLNTSRPADQQIDVDGIFGPATEKAVKAWQESVGFGASGSVDATQIIFMPTPLRVSSEPRVGTAFSALQVSGSEAAVTIETTNRDRSALPVDSEVTVELPDGSTLDGRVTDQEQAVQDDGTNVWKTTVAVTGTVPGDVNAVKVITTVVAATDVIHVPVGALIALAEGGFAVEVVSDGLTKLVRVNVGEVLDGRAEVLGELAEGDIVVVPS